MHIDINMKIDIHIIINMNIENYIMYYLLSTIYSLLAIPYWLFPFDLYVQLWKSELCLKCRNACSAALPAAAWRHGGTVSGIFRCPPKHKPKIHNKYTDFYINL